MPRAAASDFVSSFSPSSPIARSVRWFGYADRVAVVTSPADAQALSDTVNSERIAVIANGVDLKYFAHRPAPEAGRIVFTGNMSWPPNEDAAEHFARELMPAIGNRIPGASFWIVGTQPSARVQNLAGLPNIHVTGRSPISGHGSGVRLSMPVR